MEKTLALKVPNELWVNEFSENKTVSYTYTGPDKVWLLADVNSGSVYDSVYDTKPTEDIIGTKDLIEIDINSCTEAELAAVIAINTKVSGLYAYTYTDKINHDSSIYKEITNPTVFDYYSIKYVPVSGIQLELNYKDPVNPNLSVALERKAYVQKFVDTFQFEAADYTSITEYLTSLNSYIEVIKIAYPWKFITVNKNEVPRVPIRLVTLFSSLPVLT